MEDLLASIRKIIADDGGDRPRGALRVSPALHRQPHPPRRGPEADDNLSALVEKSMLDAFGVVDAEPDGRVTARHVGAGPAGDGGQEAEIEAAVHSIAKAIAAERQGRSRRPEPDLEVGLDDGGWSAGVLGEPDLDAAPQRTVCSEHQVSSRMDSGARVAAARVASLKARLDPPRDERSAHARRDPAELLPPNVYRLEPEQRTPEMTDAAVDAKPQDEDGNVFRRQTAARAELDEGLTSARTRQTVSSQFDQLSRTILTNNPRTLEDLVRDMVRPLLREWLEANLPDIVERQVRQEIDRVSARGR